MAKLTKKEFVKNFEDILADEGDMFFSCGDVEKDYDIIVGTIKRQGYWAGTSVRYMFDGDLNFEGVQPRMFGA